MACTTSAIVHVSRSLGEDETPVAHDRDAIRDREDLFEAVRHVQHGHARLAQLSQDVEEALRFAVVERGVGLIEDEQPRSFDEDPADLQELALIEVEIASQRIGIDVEADAGERGPRPARAWRVGRRAPKRVGCWSGNRLARMERSGKRLSSW